uniref:Uncharacterized protein n=1 Tax=viral metagenome TaxID=1070528 RepID=A0A6M3Y117_9ZZZZ
MKPNYSTYEIEVWPWEEDKGWDGDQFVRLDVTASGSVSFVAEAGYGAKDKATMVAWLRKAADALEKATFE